MALVWYFLEYHNTKYSGGFSSYFQCNTLFSSEPSNSFVGFVIELNCKATPLFAICRPSWPVSTLRLEHCSIAGWLLIDHYMGMPALRTAEGKLLRVYYTAVSIVLNEPRSPPASETSRITWLRLQWSVIFLLQTASASSRFFIDCIVRSPQRAFRYLGRPGRFYRCCCCLRRLQLLCMLAGSIRNQ